MHFYIPSELTDPMVRSTQRISHGESLTIDLLAARVDEQRVAWLDANPGWVYTGTSLVKCADGAPSPSYDVELGFKRPRTPAELNVQTQDREAYVKQKQADFARREATQKALLAEVLSSLEPSKTPPETCPAPTTDERSS